MFIVLKRASGEEPDLPGILGAREPTEAGDHTYHSPTPGGWYQNNHGHRSVARRTQSLEMILISAVILIALGEGILRN